MRKLFILITIIGCLFASNSWGATCSGSSPTWSCPSGTTVATVNATITAATAGDTINFASGSYTWDGTINLSTTKAVSLIGTAGASSTLVDITGGRIFCDGSTSTGTYRISGFTLNYAVVFHYGAVASINHVTSRSTCNTSLGSTFLWLRADGAGTAVGNYAMGFKYYAQ